MCVYAAMQHTFLDVSETARHCICKPHGAEYHTIMHMTSHASPHVETAHRQTWTSYCMSTRSKQLTDTHIKETNPQKNSGILSIIRSRLFNVLYAIQIFPCVHALTECYTCCSRRFGSKHAHMFSLFSTCTYVLYLDHIHPHS